MLQIFKEFLSLLVATFGAFVFCRITLNEPSKISLRKLILTIFITAFIYTISTSILTGLIKTLFMGFIEVFLYIIIFKISLKKSILLTFIHMILLIIPDLIELFFVTKVLHLSIEYCYNTLAGSIISNVFVLSLLIVMVYPIRNSLRKLINTKIENDVKILIFSILTFICMGMFFYTIIKEFKIGNNVILYLIAMIVLVSVLSVLIKQTIENNKIIEKYDKLLEFMTTYENEIEKQRILRHETKNEFLVIRGKIHDKQNQKEIIAYIDEILKEKIEVKQEEYAKFGYLPANGIKGLCYLKVQESQDKGIKTSINISKRIKNSSIYKLNINEQRDLGKILGVFLDNAIEASIKSKDKLFGIEAYLNLEKECQIIISNTFDEKINLDKIGRERFSTKGRTRGHGLLLVKHIVDNNTKFKTDTKIIKNLYIQTVTIKNSNSNETMN